MPEKLIQQKIFRAIGGRLDVRLFRNNTGVGFQGKAYTVSAKGPVMLQPGDVVIRNARRVRFGLCVGSSDLIGWQSIKITADMVGKVFAKFLAIEVKAARGRATEDQKNFIDVVTASGGRAGVARSEHDAADLIGG